MNRGGSYLYGADGIRAADRCRDLPSRVFEYKGFRIVRSVERSGDIEQTTDSKRAPAGREQSKESTASPRAPKPNPVYETRKPLQVKENLRRI